MGHPDYILDVLEDVHDRPRRVSSNWAREYAPEIAAAASMGLITTREAGVYGRSWRLTSLGLLELEAESC